MTFEKMRERFCMPENLSSTSVANKVGVGCKRASANARANMVTALFELLAGTGHCVGRTILFWRCVLRKCVGCIRGGIISGQGRVRDTIHLHCVGTRCGGCWVSLVL